MDLFRDNALDRLTTPVVLTERLNVVTISKIVIVGCILLFILSILAWSFLGHVYYTAKASGIFLNQGGISECVASHEGTIKSVLVSVDELVTKGQKVAIIRRPDLELLVQLKKEELFVAEQRHNEFKNIENEILLKKLDSIKLELTGIKISHQYLNDHLEWLQKVTNNKNKLFDEGIISEYQRQNALLERNSVDAEFTIHESKLKENIVKELEAIKLTSLNIINHSLKSEIITRELAILEDRLKRESQIVSPLNGRIIEINKRSNSVVEFGDSVALIERIEKELDDLRAALFFRPEDGKRLSIGSKIRLIPGGVNEVEYGAMLGSVVDISPFPASHLAIHAILGNHRLVDEYTAYGAPIVVIVKPIQSLSKNGTYVWTSGHTPPIKIASGSVCEGNALIEDRNLISLAIPWIRKTASLGSQDSFTEK